jgi:hypothetical protein
MAGRRQKRAIVALVGTVLLALGLAAVAALAGVTVYKNNFSSRAEVRELERVAGKHCDRRWRKKARSVRVEVKKGPERCGYEPPVQGDSARPDHVFQATGKLLKQTSRRVRGGAYVAVAARVGKKSAYELRIFPARQKYQLRRDPSGGGGGFPAKGTSNAIKGVNKPNALRLKVVDDKVSARVNGTKLAAVTDARPNQLKGRKLEVSVGHKRTSRRAVIATLDDLKLQVPKP